MTGRIGEFIRWSAIVLLSGVSLFILILGFAASNWNDWPATTLALTVAGLLASIPLFIAAMLLKRNYAQLIVTFAFTASLGLFLFLTGLPAVFGLDDYADQVLNLSLESHMTPLENFATSSLYLLFAIIFPFWVSKRFYRLILAIASRRLCPRQQPCEAGTSHSAA